MPQNLIAACRPGNKLIAKHIKLKEGLRNEVVNIFLRQEKQFRQGIETEVEFDGSWKPDENEVLTVDLTDECKVFIDAIDTNTIAIPKIDIKNFENERIKALFLGENSNGTTKILVQRFTAQQILSRNFSFIGDGEEFDQLTDTAFTLNSALACIIEQNKLKFKSFAITRSIVNLSSKYREATDRELQIFANNDCFNQPDIQNLQNISNQTARKLVHAVVERGILEKYSISQISEAAASVGITVATQNGFINLPTTSKELTTFLRFLDDGQYRAHLSDQCYITNSKKPV